MCDEGAQVCAAQDAHLCDPVVTPTPIPSALVVMIGQSNMLGSVTTDLVWGGADLQDGATVILNGVTLSAYPSVPGPLPYVVEAMLAQGVVAPTVVVSAGSGQDIAAMAATYVPQAIADVDGLGGADPSAVWFWQGEADASDPAKAAAYEANLTALVGQMRAAWPTSQVYVQELLTVVPADHATVRTAQSNVDAALAEVTEVFSRTPSVLVTTDNVHATPNPGGGYDTAVDRVSAVWSL
jgi:hypothetical protein